MNTTEEIYEKIKRHQLQPEEVKGLDDIYLVEGVAMEMKELKDKIEFQKEFKKRKIQYIIEEIEKLTKEHNMLRDVIVKTLEQHDSKTLSFPGSCKIVSRKLKDKWIIDDEDAFVEVLKKENELDNVAEEMTSYKIIKNKANKLLEDWKKSNKVPECVTREDSPPSLSITYLDDEKKIDEETLPVKEKEMKEADYDKLDFS